MPGLESGWGEFPILEFSIFPHSRERFEESCNVIYTSKGLSMSKPCEIRLRNIL